VAQEQKPLSVLLSLPAGQYMISPTFLWHDSYLCPPFAGQPGHKMDTAVNTLFISAGRFQLHQVTQ
jgi:hypothetical protein